MRTKPCLLALTLAAASTLHAAEPCQTFHGRANYFGGDGQLRLWHIGTHHEFEPDAASADKVMAWLLKGVPADRQHDAIPASSVYLYGDFTVCPVEPFRAGAVQQATVKSVQHMHYVPIS